LSALDPFDSKSSVTALRKLQKIYGNEGSVFFSSPAPGDRADALEKVQ